MDDNDEPLVPGCVGQRQVHLPQSGRTVRSRAGQTAATYHVHHFRIQNLLGDDCVLTQNYCQTCKDFQVRTSKSSYLEFSPQQDMTLGRGSIQMRPLVQDQLRFRQEFSDGNHQGAHGLVPGAGQLQQEVRGTTQHLYPAA